MSGRRPAGAARDLLDIDDLDPDELVEVLDLSERADLAPTLTGEGVALVFTKPSARTRSSMELAVIALGGHPVTIRPDEIGIDTRETAEDVARTLAAYHSLIAARVHHHRHLERMAAAVEVPVVNLLSDEGHPVQALADLLTIRQHLGALAGRSVAYVGDANNVCRSLMIGAAMVGMRGRVASPPGYDLSDADLDHLRGLGMDVVSTHVPEEAVAGADVVYTDAWTSMGQEDEAAARRRDFDGFTIDAALFAEAAPEAVFLHCLPAHRGEEVTDEVIDGERSLVWAQAANRLHSARGLLSFLTR